MNRFCQVNPLVVRREAAHGQWMESAAHCRGRAASSTTGSSQAPALWRPVQCDVMLCYASSAILLMTQLNFCRDPGGKGLLCLPHLFSFR